MRVSRGFQMGSNLQGLGGRIAVLAEGARVFHRVNLFRLTSVAGFSKGGLHRLTLNPETQILSWISDPAANSGEPGTNALVSPSLHRQDCNT